MTPEFSRRIDIRNLPDKPLKLEAHAAERTALATRIGIESIERLEAEVTLLRAGTTIDASGRVKAEVIQVCAVSTEPFQVRVDEPLTLRFVQGIAPHKPDEELEIDAEACDEIEFEGTQFDLGEQIAQTLSLAIDPYAVGPDAERVREDSGLLSDSKNSPFAILSQIKK